MEIGMFKPTILALLLGTTFATPALAQEKIVPIEAFVEQEQFSIPRLSPDGKAYCGECAD